MQIFKNLVKKRKRSFILIPLFVLFITLSILLPSLSAKFYSHGQSAISPTCPKIIGPFSQQGSKILTNNGVQYIPYGITTSGLSGAQYQNRIASDEAQIQAAGTVWCSNIVRIQVGQDNLVGANGTTVSQDFMNALKQEVSYAENLGLVVVINAQTESVGYEQAPTQATRAFWKELTQVYGKDPQVVFDVFNEPRVNTGIDSQTWQLWQKGGLYQGVTYLGMQDLVNEVRGDGAKNLLWIEGPYVASTLEEVSTYPINDSLFMYAIHHPRGLHNQTSWENDFGFLATKDITPVVVGEWSNWAAAKGECWKDAPTAVPEFLSYLQHKQIGMTVWTLRKGVMLESDNFSDPSQIKPDWSCTNGLDEGAGLLVLNWYKSMQSTVTPTISPIATQFIVTVCPHGLGNCGDNVKSPYPGNLSPKHTTLPVQLLFLSNAQSASASISGILMYNPSSQKYQGTITTSHVSSGQYVVIVRVSGYLGKQVPGIITVTQGQQVTLPPVFVVAGDVNQDNVLNILDYEYLLSCFDKNATSSSCLAPINSQSKGADINDDGVVDGTDYNLFIRELSVQNGSGSR